MTHRIKEVKSMPDFVVLIMFQDGIEKEYDVKPLFVKFPQFCELKKNNNLWKQVRVDVGGYGIVWDDMLDLSSEELWSNGKETGKQYDVDVASLLGANFTKAREQAGLTQKELSEKVGIYQADISKIERGKANPSLQTLKRLAEGIGMELKIDFMPKK